MFHILTPFHGERQFMQVYINLSKNTLSEYNYALSYELQGHSCKLYKIILLLTLLHINNSAKCHRHQGKGTMIMKRRKKIKMKYILK